MNLLLVFGRLYLAWRRLGAWMTWRFTAIGSSLLIGLLVSLGTADRDQTTAFGMFLVLGALLVSALAFAPWFRPQMGISRQLPRLVTAGVPFAVRILVENRGPRAMAGLEYTEDMQEPGLDAQEIIDGLRFGHQGGPGRTLRGGRCRPVPVPVLAPDGKVEITATVVAWRRGTLRFVGGIFLHSDPLGIFRAVGRCPGEASVLVLPPRHPLPILNLPGRNASADPGPPRSGGTTGEAEFSSLRDYRRGDPRKRVHWRSSARIGRLVVKEYEDERRPRHGLALDIYCPVRHDRLFAEAVAVAASFACPSTDGAGIGDLSLLEVLVVGGSLIPEGAPAMLEILAEVQPERQPRFADLADCLLRQGTSLASWILVLLAWDPARRQLVGRLRALGTPVTVLLLLPPGQAAPAILGEPGEQPDRLVCLSADRVAEGLATLGAWA